MIRVTPLTGPALADVIEDVARLRIEVFRDFPYLYDGDMAYERDYIQTYLDSENAIVVGAFDGDRLVGAATGTPMEDHADDFSDALADLGLPLERIFYNAESVLLPDWRGQGIGHAFFDTREAHARALGRTHAAFCGVIRPKDHPMRPANYRPLDPFWIKRGYRQIPDAIARFSWKDLGQDCATQKPLQFWIRTL